MKLKKSNDENAVYHGTPNYGPAFGGGCDLKVEGTKLTTWIRFTFDDSSIPAPLVNGGERKEFQINNIEVFQVLECKDAPTNEEEGKTSAKISKVEKFTEDINNSINAKIKSLAELELEIHELEKSFNDEQSFITSFTSGETKDIVTLNVSGTTMVTKRATLCSVEESSLAQQFDDTKWTEQGSSTNRVKEWTPNEVCDWAKKIDDISDEVAHIFVENEITGNELLALNMDGLKMIGIERAGTLCLLLEEIKKLKQSSQDTVTLIEHSPYCFGKILDYLRLKHMQRQGLIDAEMTVRPIICESQKKRFSKVVQYYFPGSAKMILPDPPSPPSFYFGR